MKIKKDDLYWVDQSMSKLNKILYLFIEQAKECGLHEADYINAREFVNYNEQGLAFDTVITQLYEYNIAIDQNFYGRAITIAEIMKIPINEYDYIQELIIR